MTRPYTRSFALNASCVFMLHISCSLKFGFEMAASTFGDFCGGLAAERDSAFGVGGISMWSVVDADDSDWYALVKGE